jgi:hypothetical protein
LELSNILITFKYSRSRSGAGLAVFPSAGGAQRINLINSDFIGNRVTNPAGAGGAIYLASASEGKKLASIP